MMSSSPQPVVLFYTNKHPFSQWHPAPFVDDDGVRFATSEHYMMYMKAKVFGDEVAARLIISEPTPRGAKHIGRRVKNFDEAVWIKHRESIIFDGNMLKFSQNHGIMERLLATGDSILAEASPRDRIYGIGMGASNPDAMNPKKWKGTNLLGLALMRVRTAV